MADDSLTDWKAAHRTLSREHSEAEEQLGMLQNLYSTSIQLLAARVPADVLKVVAEVLENLIGASGFSLFVWRPGERRARVVLRRGAGRATFSPAVSDALLKPQPSVCLSPTGQFEAAVAPLNHANELVGAIVIDGLLPQKDGRLVDTDLELLSLVSGQAGPALVRAFERARADAQNAAVEGLLATGDRPPHQPSIQGNLDETMLIEMIQMIGMVRKSGRLSVSSGREHGEFRFRHGALIGVSEASRPLALADAPAVLCRWVDQSGSFGFFVEPAAATSAEEMGCEALVLEAVRLYDESKSGRPAELPSDLT